MILKYTLALTFILVSTYCNSNAEGEKTALLKSHPKALSEAVIDSYVYALGQHFNRVEQLKNIQHSPIVLSDLQCSPKVIHKISNYMLRKQCQIATYTNYPDCKDINGCIQIKVNKDIENDIILNNLLIDTIKNPCKFIPSPEKDRFHWGGFFYPNWISYKSLNCKNKGKLPYSKFIITYGAKRVILKN